MIFLFKRNLVSGGFSERKEFNFDIYFYIKWKLSGPTQISKYMIFQKSDMAMLELSKSMSCCERYDNNNGTKYGLITYKYI